MADRIGGTLHLDISEFSRAITEANRLIKENESQWRQSAVTLGDWTKSEEGLTSKLEAVNNQIEQQRKIMDLLNGKKQKTVELYGAESKEVEAVNAQIAKYGKALDSSYKEQASLQKSLDKLNSEQAENTKETKESTTVSQKNSKAVKEQSDDYNNLSKSVSNAKQGFTVLKGVLSDLISTGIKNAVAGLKNLVNLINTLPETTKQTRREITQLKIAFNEAGFSADTVEETYSNFKAILGDTVSNVDNVLSIMASLSDNEKDLSKWTTTLTGVYAKLGKTFPTEELMKNIQQTSNSATMTENLTKVLQSAGVNTTTFAENLTSLTTAEERENYILNTLYANYGALGVEYQNVNSQMIQAEKATTDYNLALAKFGNALEPIKTEFTQAKADILDSFAELLKGTEGAENDLAYNLGYMLGSVARIFNQLKDIFKPAWDNITDSLTEWWSENKGTIKTYVKNAVESGLGIDLDTVSTVLKVGMFAKIASAIATAGGAGGALKLAGLAIGTALLVGMTDREKIDNWCDENLPSFLADLAKTFSSLFKVAFDGIVEAGELLNEIFETTEAQGEADARGMELGIAFSNAFKKALIDNAGDVNKAWKQALEELGKETELNVEKLNEITFGSVDMPNRPTMADVNALKNAGVTEAQIEELVAKSAEAEKKAITNVAGFAKESFVELDKDLWIQSRKGYSDAKQAIEEGRKEEAEIIMAMMENMASLEYDNLTGGERIATWAVLLWDGIKYELAKIKNYFSLPDNEANEIGENIVEGTANGIEGASDELIDTVNMSVDEMIEAYKKKLGIHSPSTVAEEQIGKNVVLGIDNGIWNNIDVLRGTAQESTQDVINTVETSIEQAEQEVVKVAKDSGETVVESFAKGYEAGKEGLKKTVTTVVEESFNEGTSKVDTSKSAETVVTNLANDIESSDNKSKLLSVLENILTSATNVMSSITEEVSTQQNDLVQLLRSGKWEEAFVKYGVTLSEDVKEGILRGKIDANEYAKAILPDLSSAKDTMAKNLLGTISDLIKQTGGWGMLIGTLLDVVIEGIETGNIDEYIQNLVDVIMGALEKIIDNLPSIIKAMGTLMIELAKGLVKAIPKLVEALPDILNALLETIFNDFIPAMFNVGIELVKGIGKGIWESIKTIGSWLWDGIKSVGEWIVGGFKSLFGIRSPSKLMADSIGKNITLGIAEGMVDNIDAISKSVKEVSDAIDFDVDQQQLSTLEGARSATVVNQYNTYAREHSRYEIYKSRRQLEEYFAL